MLISLSLTLSPSICVCARIWFQYLVDLLHTEKHSPCEIRQLHLLHPYYITEKPSRILRALMLMSADIICIVEMTCYLKLGCYLITYIDDSLPGYTPNHIIFAPEHPPAPLSGLLLWRIV